MILLVVVTFSKKTFLFLPILSSIWAAIGIKSSATKKDTNKVETIDIPIFWPISLIMKFPEKRKGTKTIIVVSVAAKMERQTSFVP